MRSAGAPRRATPQRACSRSKWETCGGSRNHSYGRALAALRIGGGGPRPDRAPLWLGHPLQPPSRRVKMLSRPPPLEPTTPTPGRLQLTAARTMVLPRAAARTGAATRRALPRTAVRKVAGATQAADTAATATMVDQTAGNDAGHAGGSAPMCRAARAADPADTAACMLRSSSTQGAGHCIHGDCTHHSPSSVVQALVEAAHAVVHVAAEERLRQVLVLDHRQLQRVALQARVVVAAGSGGGGGGGGPLIDGAEGASGSGCALQPAPRPPSRVYRAAHALDHYQISAGRRVRHLAADAAQVQAGRAVAAGSDEEPAGPGDKGQAGWPQQRRRKPASPARLPSPPLLSPEIHSCPYLGSLQGLG